MFKCYWCEYKAVGLSLTTVKPYAIIHKTQQVLYFYTVIGHWDMYINIYRIFKNISFR